MNYSVQDTLRNAQTWEHFCDLEKQARHPQLAVYRGRTLVIMHYEGKGIERIFIAIRGIAYRIFKAISLIKIDNNKVQELRDKIQQYCYQVAQQPYAKEIEHSKQTLEGVNKSQQQANKKLLALEQANQQALSQKNELTQQVQGLQNELNEAKKLIEEKNAREQELQKIQKTQKELETEVQKLQEAKNQLEPSKVEMQQLQSSIAQAKTELKNIKADAEQQNFKQKLAETETELKAAKAKIQQAKEQIDFAHDRLVYMGVKAHSLRDQINILLIRKFVL